MGLSIAPTPMQEVWRPTLHRAATSGGGNSVVVAIPSLPWVVLPGSVASMAVAAATVLAAIPMVTAEASPEVSLVAPPPPAMVEEERETELPALPGGGLQGSPSWLEPKAPGDSAAGTKSERLVAVHATEVVDIPSDDEPDDTTEPPVSSRELAVV